MNKTDNAHNSNIEEKILEELKKNCRLSLDEIGKKCGCSRYKASRVAKKFEDNDAIVGYNAIINPLKMNLKYYMILINRSNIPFEEEMINKLQTGDVTEILPDINVNFKDTLYMNGIYDWIITFTTDDITKAKELTNRILAEFNKYISKVELLELVIPFRINGNLIKLSDNDSNIL
jgi:DNA-binding Lrp family transcriptional regulator